MGDVALRSIVYDAGTSAESYEWLTVNSCSPDELRILDEKVNVLEIPKPPSAQVPFKATLPDCIPTNPLNVWGRLNALRKLCIAQLLYISNVVSLLASMCCPYAQLPPECDGGCAHFRQLRISSAGSNPSCPLQYQGDAGEARGMYQGSDPKRGGGGGGGRKSGALRMPLVTFC